MEIVHWRCQIIKQEEENLSLSYAKKVFLFQTILLFVDFSYLLWIKKQLRWKQSSNFVNSLVRANFHVITNALENVDSVFREGCTNSAKLIVIVNLYVVIHAKKSVRTDVHLVKKPVSPNVHIANARPGVETFVPLVR